MQHYIQGEMLTYLTCQHHQSVAREKVCWRICCSNLEGAGSNPGFQLFDNIFQTLPIINVLVANMTSALPELSEICQRVGCQGWVVNKAPTDSQVGPNCGVVSTPLPIKLLSLTSPSRHLD